MLSIPGVDGLLIDIPDWEIIVSVVISLSAVIAFYVLRSIGLYKLASRGNVNNAFLAWFPFVWMYTACKVIGKEKCFNKPFEKFALAFCIIFSVAGLLHFTTSFLIYFPVIGNFFEGRNIVLATPSTPLKPEYIRWYDGIFVDSDFVNPYKDGTIIVDKFLTVSSYISLFLDIAVIIIEVNVYMSLFRKYWPQHYMLFGLLSVFGLFSPFVFAIRNREPINYNDYIRARYNYTVYTNNPNNPYNPYNQNMNGANGQNNGTGTPPSSPFEEFAGKDEIDPGDPFSEFDNDNNKKDSK